MNDKFEIIVSPHKKWKRLALLLESESKDNCLKRSTTYNTFYYENCYEFYDPDMYPDNISYCTAFDEDLDMLKDGIISIKNKIILMWNHFIDTI